jgi:hypothetical protein
MVSTFFSYLHGTAFPLLPHPSSLARALFLHRGRCALTDQRRVCLGKTGNQCPPLASVPLRRRLLCCRQAWPTYPTQPFLNYRFLGVLPPSLVCAPSSIKFSRTQACPVHCSRRRNQRRPLINALPRHLPPSSSYLPPARVFPSAFPILSPHCYKRRLLAPTLSTTEGERAPLPSLGL